MHIIKVHTIFSINEINRQLDMSKKKSIKIAIVTGRLQNKKEHFPAKKYFDVVA